MLSSLTFGKGVDGVELKTQGECAIACALSETNETREADNDARSGYLVTCDRGTGVERGFGGAHRDAAAADADAYVSVLKREIAALVEERNVAKEALERERRARLEERKVEEGEREAIRRELESERKERRLAILLWEEGSVAAEESTRKVVAGWKAELAREKRARVQGRKVLVEAFGKQKRVLVEECRLKLVRERELGLEGRKRLVEEAVKERERVSVKAKEVVERRWLEEKRVWA